MSDTDTTRATTDWGRITLVYAAGILGAMQTGLIAPLVPDLERDLGVSLAFMGWMLSVVTGISAVLGTFAGGWSERMGHMRAIKGGLVVMAAVGVAGALTDTGPGLLAGRVVLGFGYLAVVVAGPPAVMRLARPRDLGFALALWGAFVPVGIALAEGLVGVFLDRLGWRGLFWGNAAILAAAAVVALAVLKDDRPTAARAAMAPVWTVFGMKGPLLLMLAFGSFTFTFMILAGMVPAYLHEGRGVAAGDAGSIVAVATLFGIPGTLGAGFLIRRGAAPARLALVGLVVPAIASIVLFLPGLPVSAMTLATVVAFLAGGMIPAATYALLPLVAPDPRDFAPVNGLLTQIGSAGTLLGPPLFAAWSEAAGWNWDALPGVAAAAGGIACLLALRAPLFAASR